MLRDITLGQYYPVDSVLHRMDPRTKLFGTMVFIISLFVADSIWAYLVATLFLAMAIRLSHVPFKFMVRGLKAIIFLLSAVVFKGDEGGINDGRIHGSQADLSGGGLIGYDADDHA